MSDPVYVPLVAADGKITETDPESAQMLLAGGGYSVPSPEQLADHAHKQQLTTEEGGLLGGLKAGAEGAAQALTLGGSTWGETQLLGVDPERIKAREELNPAWHGIGTGIGIAAPLLLSGGAAAPEEAAALAPGTLGTVSKLTAPSLIAQAGHAATEGVRGLLAPGAGTVEAAGLTADAAARAVPGLGRRLLIRGVPGAAGAALEGALYGLGDDIHESALGDPLFSGESAGRIGLSALMAGGIGGGLGLGKGAVDALGAKLGGSGWLTDKIGEFAGIRGMKAAGAIQKHFNRIIDQFGPDAPAEMGNAFYENRLVGPGTTFRDTLDRSKELWKSAGEDLGEQRAAADAIAKPLVPSQDRATYGKPVSPWGAAADTVPAIQDVVSEARKTILAPMLAAGKTESTERASGALSKLLDKYESDYAEGMTYSDLHKMETEVGKESDGLLKSVNAMERPAGRALRQFRRQLSDRVEQGISDLGLDLDKWQENSWRFRVGRTGEEFAKAGLKREGNNAISPTEFLSILGGTGVGGPLGGAIAGAGTAAVRRYGSGVAGALARALKGAIEGEADELPGAIAGAGPKGEPPPEGGAPAAPVIPEPPPEIPPDPTLGKPQPHENDQEAWDKEIAGLQEELRKRRQVRAVNEYPPNGIREARGGGLMKEAPAPTSAPSQQYAPTGLRQSRGGGAMDYAEKPRTKRPLPETVLETTAKDSSGVTRALKRVQEQQFAQALGLKELDDGTRHLLDSAVREGMLGKFTGPERLLARAQEAVAGAEAEIRSLGAGHDVAGRARLQALATARGVVDLAERMLKLEGTPSRVDARMLEGLEPASLEAPPGFGAPSRLVPEPGAPTASPEQGAALEVMRRMIEREKEALEAKVSSSVADIGKGRPSGPDLSKLSTKEIQAQIEHLRTLARNPMRLAADTQAHLHDLADHAPETATNAAATMAKGIGELNKAAPELPVPTLGDPKPELERGKALEFAKLKAAVEDPAKADWSDPAVWRIIKAVYPAYAAQVAGSILQRLPAMPTPHQIQFAGQVTGMPLQPTADPATQAIIQQLMQTAPQKGAHGHGGSTGIPKARLSKPGVGKMHFATATETATRAVAGEKV